MYYIGLNLKRLDTEITYTGIKFNNRGYLNKFLLDIINSTYLIQSNNFPLSNEEIKIFLLRVLESNSYYNMEIKNKSDFSLNFHIINRNELKHLNINFGPLVLPCPEDFEYFVLISLNRKDFKVNYLECIGLNVIYYYTDLINTTVLKETLLTSSDTLIREYVQLDLKDET